MLLINQGPILLHLRAVLYTWGSFVKKQTNKKLSWDNFLCPQTTRSSIVKEEFHTLVEKYAEVYFNSELDLVLFVK